MATHAVDAAKCARRGDKLKDKQAHASRRKLGRRAPPAQCAYNFSSPHEPGPSTSKPQRAFPNASVV